MKKNNNIFYEIQPYMFYDSNNSGVGDYNGISQRIKYFLHLGINNLVLPSILENYQKLTKLEIINKHYGSIEDLKEMIQLAKNQDLNVYMEFDFQKFDEYLIYLKNLEIIFNNDLNYKNQINQTMSFYIDKNNVKDLKFDWYSSEKINGFKKIMEFYSQFKFKGIIFKNFEYIASQEANISDDTIHILNELFSYVKNLNSNIILMAKTDKKKLLKNKKFLKLLNNNNFKGLIDESFSPWWLHKKNPKDILKKYQPWKLKLWLLNTYYFSGANFVCFNRKSEGRIASRLIKDNKNLDKMQKMLFTLQILFFHQPYIFQGDEIGQDNVNFITHKEFNDYSYNQTKRFLATKNINSNVFFQSRSKLSEINMLAPFSWRKEEKLGFTNCEKFYYKKSKNYLKNNLENLHQNPKSIFNFYKNLINFRNLYFPQNFDRKIHQKISLTLNLSIFKSKFFINNETYYLIINLSEKNKKYRIKEEFEIIFNNYDENKNEKIRKLRPFEIYFLKIKN